MFWPTQLLLFLLFIGETREPNWDNEEEVSSQLILLGLVGIDTLDEFVSKRVKEILKSCHVEKYAKISFETSIKLIDFNSKCVFRFFFQTQSTKRAVEGELGEKTFKSFQDRKEYKLRNFKEPNFVEDLCRGIAVNTSYSSNIEVNNTYAYYCSE